ncbi:cyclic pyranopterin monophosphate synthase MoaC [Agromyces sp. MMS24-JH15]|uniref:cyclic pyranopterin monophosphate synthase MoaC n=1 Tax=Agromyces sp. MMS24-JH15 TaxID=3243765 RepID=UPI003747AEC2
MTELTHRRADGAVHMVDVGSKPPTRRVARAEATLVTRPDVVGLLAEGRLPKGEAIGVARVAGIMAAKQTPQLVPLCHPILIDAVEVDFDVREDRVVVTAEVATTGGTGVEMEAITAATVAAISLYDMVKAVDRLATIEGVRLVSKSGGKSGDWVRP